METGKIISKTLPLLKKYAPIALSPRNIELQTAYTMGYMKGWLIASGRIKEIEKILEKEEA